MIVVTNNHDSLPSKSTPLKNLVVYRLPCFPFLNARLPWPKRNAEFRQLMNEIKDEPIDYVCINTRFYPHSLIGAKLSQKKGLIPVVIEHGSDYLTLGSPLIDGVIRCYERAITKRLKTYHPKFYAVSQRSSEWLSTFDIQSEGEICNAIDAKGFRELQSERSFRQELQIPESDSLVVFAGRLTSEKGIEQLVEAARLLNERSDIHFAIAGGGTLQDKLEQQSPLSMHFLGVLSREDLSALLQEADVFCLPSRSEGFATVLLEAASCGTVPVITDFGGADEMVPSDEFGVLLPNSKPQTIAGALTTVCDNREGMNNISSRIKERAERNYNWHETATALINALRATN